jgi:hypothetical protein
MLEQITDPDGHVVDIGYNANGQVDSITQVIASGNGPTTTFAWQAAPAGVTVNRPGFGDCGVYWVPAVGAVAC